MNPEIITIIISIVYVIGLLLSNVFIGYKWGKEEGMKFIPLTLGWPLLFIGYVAKVSIKYVTSGLMEFGESLHQINRYMIIGLLCGLLNIITVACALGGTALLLLALWNILLC